MCTLTISHTATSRSVVPWADCVDTDDDVVVVVVCAQADSVCMDANGRLVLCDWGTAVNTLTLLDAATLLSADVAAVGAVLTALIGPPTAEEVCVSPRCWVRVFKLLCRVCACIV